MKTVLFPYGKEKIKYTFGDELKAVLESEIEEYDPQKSEQDLIFECEPRFRQALHLKYPCPQPLKQPADRR